MSVENLTPVSTYSIPHGKNSGGSAWYGTSRAGLRSTSATVGNFKSINCDSLKANNANIVYLTTREAKAYKISGNDLNYKNGYIANLQLDGISAKKLSVDELEAVKAYIETLNSKNITTEYLTVTKQAHFFELIIDKIRAVGGQLIITPASCIIDYVYAYDSQGNLVQDPVSSLSSVAYFDVYWKSTDSDGHSVTNDFIANDQAICQSFNNAQEGVSHNVSNKYYWRLVDRVLTDIYINLSTGAKSLEANESNYNTFEIKMHNPLQKTGEDAYEENTIEWQCEAQTIEGIYTGVVWSGYEDSSAAIEGTFDTSSQIYGIQITPAADSIPQITNKITFTIKQVTDTLGTVRYGVNNHIDISVYFADSKFMYFRNVLIDPDTFQVELDLGEPETEIVAITIVCTDEVNWHLCHGIRLSNNYIAESVSRPYVASDDSGCDYMLVPEASIPEAGDNLVQLGYRGNDEINSARQSAIIISAYHSRDAFLTAPSYAQYQGINNFDLESHRGSYIDANGAKFIGDITMCSIDGKNIKNILEQNNKKLISDADIINVFNASNSISIVPETISLSVLMSDPENEDNTILSNTVPHGYAVMLTYYDNNSLPIEFDYDEEITEFIDEDETLTNISLYVGQTSNSVHFLRAKLVKLKNGVQRDQLPVVDVKDITYQEAAEDGINGGHYEFRYKNATVQPEPPFTGFDGTTGGWEVEPTTPDFENGEYTWMTQCFVSEISGYGIWTTPIRITGDNGLDGEDGADIEFIYTQNDTGTAPSAPVYDMHGDPISDRDDWYGVDSNGIIWYDNPQGVGENVRWEYVSVRQKPKGAEEWSSFSTPVVWSKWGEKGQDGDGFEYIYKLTAEKVEPANPTPQDITISTYQNDDYVPDGWTDDPQTVSQTFPFQWVCVRKKHGGLWGAFDGPVLWARYAEVGETGGHYEFRYKNSATQPSLPTGTGLTDGWSNEPTTPDIEHGEYTWMSQTFVTPDINGDVYGTWTDPIRITGPKGETGADGADIEFIYKVQNSATAPLTPATQQQDDYIPTGWTDNPQGVSENNMYEFVCTRTKNNNVWGPFSTPVIWSKWGEKGQDGDGFEYIYKLSADVSSLAGPTIPSNWQNPTSDYQTHDEYVTYLTSEGWHDDPQTVSVNTNERICWVSVRKKTNGTWGRFSTPAKWSNYVLADQSIPGADGKDAELSYLIPVKETLVAKFLSAISDNVNCDLQCELQYNLVHTKGSTTNTVNWSSQSWYIRISPYNKSFNRINYIYWYATSNGSQTGTPQGTFSKSNLMTEIQGANRDYMKCYENSSSYCPSYLLVELMDGNTVIDSRNVPVVLEAGAVSKVVNDAIVEAAARTITNLNNGTVTLTNYYTRTATDSKITQVLSSELTNYALKSSVYTKNQVDETSARFNRTLTEIQTTQNSFNSNLTNVTSRVGSLEQTARGLNGKFTEIQQTVNTTTGQVSSLTTKVNNYKNDVDGFKTEISREVSNKYNELTRQISSLSVDPDKIAMSVKNDFTSAGLTITAGRINMTAASVTILGSGSQYLMIGSGTTYSVYHKWGLAMYRDHSRVDLSATSNGGYLLLKRGDDELNLSLRSGIIHIESSKTSRAWPVKSYNATSVSDYWKGSLFIDNNGYVRLKNEWFL